MNCVGCGICHAFGWHVLTGPWKQVENSGSIFKHNGRLPNSLSRIGVVTYKVAAHWLKEKGETIGWRGCDAASKSFICHEEIVYQWSSKRGEQRWQKRRKRSLEEVIHRVFALDGFPTSTYFIPVVTNNKRSGNEVYHRHWRVSLIH